MSKEPKDFEITRLLELTGGEKYAATVAAFEIIEKLDQLEIPKKYLNRKPSIQAMAALTETVIRFDYIDDETREKVETELRESRKSKSALDEVFSSAPVSDDSEEDLDEIIDMEPQDQFLDDSADEDDDGDDDQDDDEDEDQDEDSSDNDSSDDDDDEDQDQDDDSSDTDSSDDEEEEEEFSQEEE